MSKQQIINSAFDLMDKGLLDEALELLDTLTMNEEEPAYYSYLSTYGYIYTAKKDFQKALATYRTYLDRAIFQAEVTEQHIAHHQLAMVHREQGDYVSAMAELEKERAIIEKEFPEDNLFWAVYLYEIGYVSYLMGDDVQAAEEAMRKSLDLALKTDDLIAQACAYRGLGEILSNRDYFNQDRQLFEAADDEIGCQQIDDLLSKI